LPQAVRRVDSSARRPSVFLRVSFPFSFVTQLFAGQTLASMHAKCFFEVVAFRARIIDI
jgi:hypothetical protein